MHGCAKILEQIKTYHKTELFDHQLTKSVDQAVKTFEWIIAASIGKNTF